MRIIKPIDITEAVLVSSSVAETDYPVWSSATAYAVGARVLKNHRIYEALVAHSNIDPAGAPTTPATWLDLGADNRWRMFDASVSSQTTAAGSIAVTLNPGQVINSLALFNVVGRTAHVVMTDALDGMVYDRSVPLVNTGAEDWYAWFFAPFDRHGDAVLLDLPAYGTAALSVTIDNASDTAACGHLLIGTQADLGVAVYGTGVGITDYSRKETDDFGNTVVVERAFSKRAEFNVSLPTTRVSTVQRMLAAIRARPVAWIGAPGYESTVLYGYYRDFSISISGPSVADATITVEGLT